MNQLTYRWPGEIEQLGATHAHRALRDGTGWNPKHPDSETYMRGYHLCWNTLKNGEQDVAR